MSDRVIAALRRNLGVSSGAIRQLEGRDYFVVSSVMTVEGVHCGSAGCMYYPPDEIREAVDMWNAIPVVVGHPQDDDGNFVSARTPEILNRIGVGRVFDSRFIEDGAKNAAMLWIDMERLRLVSPVAAEAVANGRPIDVSTMISFIFDNQPGEWNGEQYIGIPRDQIPDHLALLPGEQGACGWADGCGVRATNKSEEKAMKSKAANAPEVNHDPGLIGKLKCCFQNVANALGLTVNEVSHDEIRHKLQRLIDKLDGNGWIHFVSEVFTDSFIYIARTSDPSTMMTMGEKLYRQGYTADADGNVATSGDPVEVRQQVDYVPVANATPEPSDKKPVTSTNSPKETRMDKTQLIDALIANKGTRLEEADRPWLANMSEEQLIKIGPTATVDPPAAAPSAVAPAAGSAAATAPPKPQTVEEYVNAAPPEVRSVLNQAMADQKAKKDQIVKAILGNKANQFSEADLDAKEVGELERIAALCGSPVDFSGRAGVVSAGAESDIAPEPRQLFSTNKAA